MKVTIVRENLMTREGYTPYCGNTKYETGESNTPCDMPRTYFNGTQFVCPHCGWIGIFPDDFIERYKRKWNIR